MKTQSLVLDRDCSIRQRMTWWSGGAYPVEGLLVAAVAERVFSQCLYRHDEKCKSPAVPNLTSDLSIQRGLYKRMKPHVDWAVVGWWRTEGRGHKLCLFRSTPQLHVGMPRRLRLTRRSVVSTCARKHSQTRFIMYMLDLSIYGTLE